MKDRTTAVEFQGARRLHVALDVKDLKRSIDFYRLLFGAEPSKLRPGYAKFEPADPSVNLTLNEGRGGHAEGSAHFGVQVRSSAAVRDAAARFRAAGLKVEVEEATECCYAVQDKVWVEDPDKNPWEVFVVTEADAPRRSPEGSACCTPVEEEASAAARAGDGGGCCGGSSAC